MGVHICPIMSLVNRVYRVPGLSSSRLYWVPHPLFRNRVLLPPFGSKGETHSPAREGCCDPIPTKRKTLWYSMYNIVLYLYGLYGIVLTMQPLSFKIGIYCRFLHALFLTSPASFSNFARGKKCRYFFYVQHTSVCSRQTCRQ